MYFPGELGSSGCPHNICFFRFEAERVRIICGGFVPIRCQSCHQINSVKAQKATPLMMTESVMINWCTKFQIPLVNFPVNISSNDLWC